jgi:predicted Zn-dependent peptidase
MAEEIDYDTLSASDLVDYYSTNYCSENVEIVLFGKVNYDMIKRIEASFGKVAWGNRFRRNIRFFIERPTNEKEMFVAKPNAVQSAVCIGKKSITRDHPDYHGLSILNAIFGGYFGSRLMSNIREDKGYTYGIYSSLTSYLHAGYMNISTQTGNENVNSVIHEVFAEMDRLRDEPVPEDELQTVRNYLLGESARRFDGPFALADAYLGLREFGLEKNFYEQRIDTIKNITSPVLQDLAERYFTPAGFRTVVAGKE